MSITAPRRPFRVREDALAAFLDAHFTNPETRVLDEDWDPRDLGSDGDIADIVRLIQDQEIRGGAIEGPADHEITFTYADDTDGGGYQWSVYLRDAGFYVGGHWNEMRKIVASDEMGVAAARSIIDEAVSQANDLMRRIGDLR